MFTYHVKKGFEILLEKGIRDLIKESKIFLFTKCTRRPLLELQKIRLKIKYGGSAPSPYKLTYVSPKNIIYYRRMCEVVSNEHFLNISKLTATYGTFVINNSWDKKPDKDEYRDSYNKMKLTNNSLFNSTIEHYKKGVEWDNTSGVHDPNLELKDFHIVEKLYNIIKNNGYKTQRDLEDGYNRYLMPPEYDEIRVNIGRDGEIFFDDGRHRICAVKMLDIDKIPVRVYVRHKEWQEFRDEVNKSGLTKKHEDLQDHPDLQDVLS